MKIQKINIVKFLEMLGAVIVMTTVGCMGTLPQKDELEKARVVVSSSDPAWADTYRSNSDDHKNTPIKLDSFEICKREKECESLLFLKLTNQYATVNGAFKNDYITELLNDKKIKFTADEQEAQKANRGVHVFIKTVKYRDVYNNFGKDVVGGVVGGIVSGGSLGVGSQLISNMVGNAAGGF